VRVVVLRLVAPAVRRWSGANHDSKAASVPSNGARGAKSVAS
jgi:hypothetical protein